MKIIKKYKWLLMVLVVLLIIVLTIIYFVFYNTKSNYGNRLEGINKVLIKEDLKNDLKSTLLSLSEVDKVNIDVKGKIINIIIIVNDDVNIDKAYQIADSTLIKFSDEILAFYDLQFFVNQKAESIDHSFPIIGYKNKTSNSIIWTLSKGDQNEG